MTALITKSAPAKRAKPAAKTKPAVRGKPELDERLFVSSIEKGMMILELLQAAGQELSLTDIVAQTDIGRSAVQRFVYSLHHLGYLSRDPDTRRYSLGPKVLGLYRGFIGGRSVLQRAQHVLRELNQTTRECTAWAELLSDEIVIVESLPSAHVTSVNLVPGMRFEALSSSSGQVLLAHSRAEVAETTLGVSSAIARQRSGVSDKASLHKLLARVRAQGYSLTEKAFDQGSLSISAPVFDIQRHPVGAVNLSALSGRFDRKEVLTSLVPAVIAAARACSQ